MDINFKALVTCALVVMLAAPLAKAQEKTTEPEAPADELDTVPVDLDTDTEPLPDVPLLEWGLSTNVQMDGLINSDLPPAREKSSELRRARVSGLLEWNFDWILKAGGDFSDGAELRELSLEYRGWPLYLEAGRMVEPFGVLQGGSRNSSLMERPQAYGLAPGYGVGVAANSRGDRWGFTAGVYKSTKNDEFEGGREENAITLRGTFTPLNAGNKVIHLGFAGSFRETEEGILQFVAIPESVLLLGLNASSKELFAGANASGTNKYWLYGIEFASMFGPMTIKSEYMQAQIGDVLGFNESNTGFESSNPIYFSYYFELAGILTGERRDYSTRRGMFGGIQPQSSLLLGGLGALELAARFSFIHLMDETLGGEEGLVLSAGLNWYPLDNIKVMLDALQIEEIRVGSSEEAFAVQARIQAGFSVH